MLTRFKKNIKKKIKSVNIACHPVYRFHKSGGLDNLVQINKCTVVSSGHGFFYCRIPKAGNSTVMATLVHAATGFVSISREDIKYAKEKVFPRAASTRLSRKVIKSDYFKFSIVRHPFSRLISGFNDKVIDASGYQEIVRGQVRPGVNDKRDVEDIFEDFLIRLEESNLIHKNYHYTPQTTLMAFSPKELDYLGRVETLEKDLLYITEKIFGAPQEIITWSPHAAESGIKPRERRMKVEMLTEDQKERINILYKQDFELLGYDLG